MLSIQGRTTAPAGTTSTSGEQNFRERRGTAVHSRADKLTGSFAPNNTVARGRYRGSYPLDPRRLSSVRLAVPRVAARRAGLAADSCASSSGGFHQL